MDKYPSYKIRVYEAIESSYDDVENKIHELIEKGDKTMIIFYAKTKMKHRGYQERVEVEQTTRIKHEEMTTDDLVKRARALKELNQNQN